MEIIKTLVKAEMKKKVCKDLCPPVIMPEGKLYTQLINTHKNSNS